MLLKAQSMTFILFLLMLSSGVVFGDEIRADMDAPGEYKPDTMNQESPNLLIGGIGQNGPNPEDNPNYTELAYQIGAMYIPMYYSDEAGLEDEGQVNLAASWFKSYIYPNGLTYWPKYENGLENTALTDKTYNTIVAYSGGTVTAVTALAEQDVKCHTLILISPIRGAPYKNPLIPVDIETALTFPNQDKSYKDAVKGLLDSGAVQRIVIIQSSKDDRIAFGTHYQARFNKGEVSGIDVYNIKLETSGEQGHLEIFEHAKDHLTLGRNGRVYYESNLQAYTLVIKGIELYKQGKYDEAIQAFDEAIGLDPNYAKAWSHKGYALSKQGKYDEAIECLDEAIRLDPNDTYPWGVKGLVLEMQGNHDEAIKCFDEAIGRDPNDANAWAGYGVVLAEIGNYDEAIGYFSEALKGYDADIEIDPNDAAAWKGKGHALNLLGRTTEANAALAKADELGYTG